MSRRSTLGCWLSPLVGLIALVACKPTPATTPKLELLVAPTGAWQGLPGPSIDLTAWLGRSASVEVQLRNEGTAPLTLSDATWAALSEPLAFAADAALPVQLAPGASVPLQVSFSPPASTGGDVTFVGELQLQLGVQGDVTVPVHGLGRAHDCSVPALVELGDVQVGDSATTRVEFVNDTDEATDVELSDLGDPAFTRQPLAASLPLGPDGRGSLDVRFAPTRVGEVTTSMRVRRTAGCPLQALTFHGTGVASCLSYRASPSHDAATGQTLDLDFAPPGGVATGQVELLNRCGRAHVVTQLSLVVPRFALALDGGPLDVPAAQGREADGGLRLGRASFGVTFSPTSLVAQRAQLTGSSEGFAAGRLVVTVNGVGSVPPRLEVSPSPLDFGDVARFPSGTSESVQWLVLRNVGSQGGAADRLLELGSPTRPALQLTAGPNSSVDELCLGDGPPSARPCVGEVSGVPLEARPLRAGDFVELPVRLMPRTTGAKSWTLTLSSNDPEQPEQRLTLVANVGTFPSCDAEVTPAIDFGNVAPPKRREMFVTVRNVGQTVCRLSGFSLAGEVRAYARLRLPGGAAGRLELLPGERAALSIELTPPDGFDGGVLGGALSFNVPNPDAGRAVVPLQALPRASCINLTMDDVDFGAVALGCASREHTFRVYNTCELPLSVVGAAFTGDLSPGDAGAAFELTTDGGLLGPIAPKSSRSFGLRYRPPSPGLHTGAFAVTVEEPTVAASVALLRGTGSATGEQEDAFVQPTGHSADVLVMADSSTSTVDELSALGAAWSAFMEYPLAQSAAFHIGVTTLDDDPSGERGALRRTSAGDSFLTPQTASVATAFADLVSVGSNGSATETALSPALKALTAPLSMRPNTNAGFQRDDATLGVVVVTDELEQAPLPNAYYVDQLLDLKGPRRQNAFSYSVFGAFTAHAPCTSSFDFDSPDGGRNFQAVGAMHGLRESVCQLSGPAAGRDDAVRRVGRRAFGWRDSVLLLSRPAPGVTPIVSIQGRALPADGGTWVYEPLENAVHFEPNFAPQPGETARVRYVTECLP